MGQHSSVGVYGLSQAGGSQWMTVQFAFPFLQRQDSQGLVFQEVPAGWSWPFSSMQPEEHILSKFVIDFHKPTGILDRELWIPQLGSHHAPSFSINPIMYVPEVLNFKQSEAPENLMCLSDCKSPL